MDVVVCFEAPDPPEGYVREDGVAERPFVGWLGLLAALEEALRSRQDDSGSRNN